jgi:indole-3-acetate monooxygenase
MTLTAVDVAGTPLERVEALREVIVRGGDEAQQIRRAPQSCIDELVDAGLFRFALPRELGGENASSMETVEILEAISAIDGSIGWNVMLGSEINAMAAGGMEPELARKVYVENPRVVMCGGGGPGSKPSRAVEQPDGGYRVWTQATFISGCHNADWCFLAAPLFDGDTLRLGPSGQPMARMFFMPRSEWQILDTWDMAGLRGSGSHDVQADGGLCAAEYVDVGLVTMPPKYDNPVYRIPVPLRLAYNKAAVALGVCKGALDAFADLANNKTPLMSTSLLRDRSVAQQRMGEATAAYRSARSYLMDTLAAVEDELHAGADWPGAATTQNARLACTHAANACLHAVDLIHNAAGTTAMRMDSPLERKLRDAHGCANHRWVAHPLYGELGKILLGHEPSTEFDGSNTQSPRPTK